MTIESIENNPKIPSLAGDGHYSQMMREVNACRSDNTPNISLNNYFENNLGPRPSIKNEWAQTELDFGNAQDLYAQSKNSPHPFTPQEIASAGANEAVMLNEYQAITAGPHLSTAGDANAPRTPGGVDLVNPNTDLMEMVRHDTPRQVADNVRANWSQSGSAGVDQQTLPDCTFESTLASMASNAKGRQDIANMITKNRDGSYEVTFPGEPNKPVEITSKDLDNNKIQDSAAWAKILEAANLKLNPDAATPGARDTSEAMHLLTGHQRENLLPGHFPRDAVNTAIEGQWLHSHLQRGDIVVAESAPPNGPTQDHHAYSVLGEANGEVIVRNPWGVQFHNGKNRPSEGRTIQDVTNIGGGELQMSLQAFNRDFDIVLADKP